MKIRFHVTHLVITYCWANFIFPISSAKSEFRSFCAISICWSKQRQHTNHHFSTIIIIIAMLITERYYLSVGASWKLW